MITIDIIDDSNERSARPVVQTYPTEKYRQQGSFDAAYSSARLHYASLLQTAQRERQARQAKSHPSFDAQRKHEVWITLSRIARALTAWL
jgi:hypothetical protein